MGASRRAPNFEQNRFRHTLRIVHRVAVPETNDAPAERLEECGPLRIVGSCIDMLRSIELHRELRASAGEVQDIGTDHMLARETRLVVTHRAQILRSCSVAPLLRSRACRVRRDGMRGTKCRMLALPLMRKTPVAGLLERTHP